MNFESFSSFFIAAAVGLASGAIGAFIILKRMALVGDALSHVALPGIALALNYSLDPFWGVLLFLLTAAMIVWWLEGHTSLPGDALVGLLFTTSLAIGVLAIPNAEIIHSLFGEFPALSPFALGITVILALGAAAMVFRFARQFVFRTTMSELAGVHRFGRRFDLLLLLLFALIVSLGIKLVGTLLMGALTIIPASIAKNLATSMKAFLLLSTLLGGIISVAGLLIAQMFEFLPGPSIILFGVGMFLTSLAFPRYGPS
ncbi:MAG TPA: metal ABC transporter permease [Acidobacteriota bacterium]|nr:metal ABC transporter permease [Acidobacteriota bacterium]